MHHLVEVWFGWVLHGGYWGIIGLMAMESSIIPIPAEVVIPPAAFLAARGDLNMAGVVIAGTVGSYIGAAIGYWLCLLIGRPLDPALREILPHHARRAGKGREMVGALRDGRRLLCPAPPGDSSSDFLSGRARRNEFLEIQPGHDHGLGNLVQRSGLPGRESLSSPARPPLQRRRLVDFC